MLLKALGGSLMSPSSDDGLNPFDEDRAASMADEGGRAAAQSNTTNEVSVYDVMSEPVVVVGPDVPISEAAQKMRDLDVSLLPIEEGERLIGVVTDRDLVLRGVAGGKDPSRTSVRDVMTRTVVCCRELDDIRDAARVMHDHEVQRLLVIDSSQRVIGVVSQADLAPRSEPAGP